MLHKLAFAFMFALAGALLVGNTSAFAAAPAADECEETKDDCTKAVDKVAEHRKLDCDSDAECEKVVDANKARDTASCELAAALCTQKAARKDKLAEAQKALRTASKDLAKAQGKSGTQVASCGKSKGKSKKPAPSATATAVATANAPTCADDADAKAAGDALRKRFADARAGGQANAIWPAWDPPLAAPVPK